MRVQWLKKSPSTTINTRVRFLQLQKECKSRTCKCFTINLKYTSICNCIECDNTSICNCIECDNTDLKEESDSDYDFEADSSSDERVQNDSTCNT